MVTSLIVIDNSLSHFIKGGNYHSINILITMDHQKEKNEKNFRIDWQGYNTDDQRKREERVDVSPAGTEGIFIDLEPPGQDTEEQ